MAQILGTPGDDTLTGTSAADSLAGFAGNDMLAGLDGNDFLDGGTGADQMDGGNGDDVYFIDDAGDSVIEGVNGGRDTAYVSTNYSLSATAAVELLLLRGAAVSLSGSESGNQLIGNDLNNTLSGLGGNDNLQGGNGNDILLGGAGIDYLYGQAGADQMRGGADDDVYSVDDAGDQAIEVANEGFDRLYTTVSYAMNANTSIEYAVLTGSATSLTGSSIGNELIGNDLANTLSGLDGNDSLKGEGGNDTLFGGSGNDFFDGGSGGDLAFGGTGDDIFLADNAGDDIREFAGQGFDRVYTSADIFLGSTSEVEFVRMLGGAVTAGGSNTNNQIVGNDNNNLINGYGGDDDLQGGDGNDYVLGAAGNDLIDGGGGADRMEGGTGDDVYVVDNAGDKVIETAGQGSDRVFSSVDYVLDANAEIEALILTGTAVSGTGSNSGTQIIGNAEANILIGGAGNDRILAMDGDDRFFVGAGNDFVDGGAGFDRLVLSGSNPDGYKFTQIENGFTIQDIDLTDGDDGTDTVINVEQFQFGGEIASAAPMSALMMPAGGTALADMDMVHTASSARLAMMHDSFQIA